MRTWLEAYVGFTASTGGAIAEMGIFNFEMRNVSEASADFSQTDLKVVSSGTLRTQFDEAVGFGTLVVDGDATLTLGDVGGTGSGAIEIGTLDCRAGGMLTVTGGSLAARNGMLTLIVPTPLDAGKVVKLIDLNGSQWQGPLAVNVVDANGNSLKARAFVSGGALKLSTADGTVIYFR